MVTLGPSLFHKYSNPSKKFQTVLFFARVLPLVRLLAILDHIGGVKTQKTSNKGYFLDAESVRKTLEIFNLTTTNVILMKLNTIMYLHESVNWEALRVRNSYFWLNLIASLVKLLRKLDDISKWLLPNFSKIRTKIAVFITLWGLSLGAKLGALIGARGLKSLWKWAAKNFFFLFIFDIYYVTWKVVKYVMSYTDMHHW